MTEEAPHFDISHPPAAQFKKKKKKVPPDRFVVGSKQNGAVASYQTADRGLKLGEISALSTLMWYSANTYQSAVQCCEILSFSKLKSASEGAPV